MQACNSCLQDHHDDVSDGEFVQRITILSILLSQQPSSFVSPTPLSAEDRQKRLEMSVAAKKQAEALKEACRTQPELAYFLGEQISRLEDLANHCFLDGSGRISVPEWNDMAMAS